MNKSCNCHKEPWLAVVLSSFLAGIGQIYAGRKWQGSVLIFTVVALGCLSIWSVLSPKCDILFTAGVYIAFLIVWIWNLFDAHKCARKANSDNFEAERKRGKDAWLAVFLSKLIPGLGQIYIKKRLLGIVLIIAAGFLLAVNIKYPLLGVVFLSFFSMPVCYHAYISAPIRRDSFNRTILIVVILILCSHLLNAYGQHAFKAYIAEAFIIATPVRLAYPLPANISRDTSMKPTLVYRDRVLVRKSKKYVPKRGDVVAFKFPEDRKIPFIMRVAALSGETIEIKDKMLFINGHKVKWPIIEIPEYTQGKFGIGEPYKVPENCFFVLGDNIVNSYDSRFFGSIPLSDLIGKAYKIYWPIGRSGPIE